MLGGDPPQRAPRAPPSGPALGRQARTARVGRLAAVDRVADRLELPVRPRPPLRRLQPSRHGRSTLLAQPDHRGRDRLLDPRAAPARPPLPHRPLDLAQRALTRPSFLARAVLDEELDAPRP